MKKKMHKIVSGTAGAAMLLGGAAAVMPEPLVKAASLEKDNVVKTEAGAFALEQAEVKEAAQYKEVANVQGEFSFDQNILTPADDVFNLFGSVLTGMCAKPAFALEGQATQYVNVGGAIKKAYTVDLQKLREEEQKEKERILTCECATGAATATARVKGIPVADILEMAGDLGDANTITVKGGDGYALSLPLSYVLDKEAMVVYQLNDQELPTGTQLWIPETVAKYFIRNVVDIELTHEDVLPEVEQRNEELRANVSLMNYADGHVFHLGDQITFQGYADDCGDAIAAVEFSLDGGKTWTACETKDATADRWVFWNFAYTPEEAGSYKLTVRARTASGNVSPLEAGLVFEVAAD